MKNDHSCEENESVGLITLPGAIAKRSPELSCASWKLQAKRIIAAFGTALVVSVYAHNVSADYLNAPAISIALGPETKPKSLTPKKPFNNLSTEQSLKNVIDAPSASASEFHNQRTHIWVTGVLHLMFDLGQEYDLATLHFWNYIGESYDVDKITLEFFDSSFTRVGTQTVLPALGQPGTYSSAGEEIEAEDISLADAKRVRFVSAVFTSTNDALDFNNMGFTGELSSIEESSSRDGIYGGDM